LAAGIGGSFKADAVRSIIRAVVALRLDITNTFAAAGLKP
jgi:hypothetical protein